jgi:hypothetical protein
LRDSHYLNFNSRIGRGTNKFVEFFGFEIGSHVSNRGKCSKVTNLQGFHYSYQLDEGGHWSRKCSKGPL